MTEPQTKLAIDFSWAKAEPNQSLPVKCWREEITTGDDDVRTLTRCGGFSFLFQHLTAPRRSDKPRGNATSPRSSCDPLVHYTSLIRATASEHGYPPRRACSDHQKDTDFRQSLPKLAHRENRRVFTGGGKNFMVAVCSSGTTYFLTVGRALQYRFHARRHQTQA